MCHIFSWVLQAGPHIIKLPASAMPPMQQALQSGWFDATFPCASALSIMLEAEVLAEVATFHMAADNWAQGFEVLSQRLTAGNPDACAYQRPFTLYLEYAMTQHKEMLGLDLMLMFGWDASRNCLCYKLGT